MPWGWPVYVQRRNKLPHDVNEKMKVSEKKLPASLDLEAAMKQLEGEKKDTKGPVSPDLEAAMKSEH